MRLLFVSERFSPDPGGVAASAERISLALARIGHSVEVLTLSSREAPGRARSDLSEYCLSVHRFGPFDDVALTLEQVERLALLLHRRHRFEAVWGHGLGTGGFLATALARRVGIPLVLGARGDDFDRDFYPPGDFGRLEWCLRSASVVNAVSADLAARIRAAHRPARGRAAQRRRHRTVSAGAAAQRAGAPLRAAAGRPRAGFLRRVAERQGHDAPARRLPAGADGPPALQAPADRRRPPRRPSRAPALPGGVRGTGVGRRPHRLRARAGRGRPAPAAVRRAAVAVAAGRSSERLAGRNGERRPGGGSGGGRRAGGDR